MTDDELKALAIGQAWMALRKAERIRDNLMKDLSSSDADRKAARDAMQTAYDHWLTMRDSI